MAVVSSVDSPSPNIGPNAGDSPRLQRLCDRLRRALYIEWYGFERFRWAQRKAQKHRERASKQYGCTEHFDAFDWLDCCDATGFCCGCCGDPEERPEPHHIKRLADGGSNTVENLRPVCRWCHERIGRYPSFRNVSGELFEEQWALFERCPPGTRVPLRHLGRGVFGKVVEREPPERYLEPIFCYTFRDVGPPNWYGPGPHEVDLRYYPYFRRITLPPSAFTWATVQRRRRDASGVMTAELHRIALVVGMRDVALTDAPLGISLVGRMEGGRTGQTEKQTEKTIGEPDAALFGTKYSA